MSTAVLTPHSIQQTLTQFDPKKPTLLIYSGPSGVGKGTITDSLQGKRVKHSDYINPTPFDAFEKTVSMTTRAPRPGEVNGVDYDFVTKDQFEIAIRHGDMIEFKRSGNGENIYGTPKASVAKIMARHKLPVLEIETEGMKDIVKSLSNDYNIVSLFMLPPLTEQTEDLTRRIQIAMDAAQTDIDTRSKITPLLSVMSGDDVKTKRRLLSLYARLDTRGTDSSDDILLRMTKAVTELQDAPRYTFQVVSDRLEKSVPQVQAIFSGVYKQLILRQKG